MKLKCLVASVATCLCFTAQAEKVTYACQYLKSAGMDWRTNYWHPMQYIVEDPFFLATDNRILTKESVAKVFGTVELFVHCLNKDPTVQSCVGETAQTIVFNADTLTGGVSKEGLNKSVCT